MVPPARGAFYTLLPLKNDLTSLSHFVRFDSRGYDSRVFMGVTYVSAGPAAKLLSRVYSANLREMSAAIKRDSAKQTKGRTQGRIDALFLPTHDAQPEDRALQPLADGSSRAKLKEEK